MKELYHYGVKGMHWGVRKDPDRKGSLFGVKKDPVKAEKKRVERVKRQFSNNWHETYNKASDDFNSQIEGINKKYEGKTWDSDFSNADGQRYLKEVNLAWKTAYKKALIDDYGEDAKLFMESAPGMNNYESYIKK